MPPRNVVPKPLQRPHPPMWVACSRRETIQFAARNGIGALSFSFVEPEDAGKWAEEYYELIESEECVPAGFAVNPNVAVVLPMMLHEDEATAIERGIDGAHFFGYSLAHYYGMGTHQPGRTNVWEEFLENRDATGLRAQLVRPDEAPLAVKIMQEGLGSLRGAIGTPDQVTDLLRRYEAVGVDQVIFVLQAGPNLHEHICESIELFGGRVAPLFAEGARGARAGEGGAAGRPPSSGRWPAARPRARRRPATRSTSRPSWRARRARAAPAGCASARSSSATRSAAPAATQSGADRPARARRERRAARAPLRQPARPARDLHGHGPPVRAAVRVRLRGRHRLRARARRQPGPPARWVVRVKDGAASALPGRTERRR